MTPWVTRLLIANVVVFVLAPPGSPLYQGLMFVPAWVLAQLRVVHPQADDALVPNLGRQMADPTAHQVEDLTVLWEVLPIKLCNGRYGPVVYVGDESWRSVEFFVR